MPAPAPIRRAPAAGYDQAMIAALGETGLPGVKETLDFHFFDTKTWATATAQAQQYFSAPGTNPLRSNFQGSGALPAGQAFLVRSLRLIPALGSPALDVLSALKNLSVVFNVENAKKYAEGPAYLFPAGVGLTSEQVIGAAAPLAPANGVSIGNAGVASLGNVYRFQKPVVLRPQQNFAVTLTSAATITLTASLDLTVLLDGVFVRNVI